MKSACLKKSDTVLCSVVTGVGDILVEMEYAMLLETVECVRGQWEGEFTRVY